MKKIYPLLIAILFLSSCATIRTTPAPIVDGTTIQSSPPPVASTAGSPVSTKPSTSPSGDSSSSTTIAKASDDEDGTVVSNTNNKQTNVAESTEVTKPKPTPVTTVPATETVIIGGLDWQAPTKGKIVQPFNMTTKGIDVQGKEGQTIVAAADGKVAYSGNGLKGYGNLVIIKHDEGYLTAYSHNRINVVKEGDIVKRGQKIAELGKTESDKPILHFELRKSGKPVDPTLIFKQ